MPTLYLGNTMAAQSDSPALALEHISVHFEGLKALTDVSFTVSSGEIVGMIGPNGAGKTTAFNVACGFIKPSEGRVLFPSKNKENLKPNQLAGAGVARTLQGVGLFPHCTVLENVMAGGQVRTNGGFTSGFFSLPSGVRAERELRQDAFAMLERFGISHMAMRLPSAIPYGIAKKVSVARALMCDPNLLLLDEPASGLDEAELAEFGALITQLRSSMGILLVEHDMEFVMPLVDRLVVLNFGEVIATGTPNEVRVDEAVIAAYLGVDE
jgi:branched-chain amino acid transport system ATP-binding protein